MPVQNLEDAIALNHAALDAMVNGDFSGYLELLSKQDDVSWGNPFGPFARGRANVEATLANAAARMQGGAATEAVPVATYRDKNLAVVVEVENAETMTATPGVRSAATLRVTSVYRLEGDAWKLVHRHADPISTPR